MGMSLRTLHRRARRLPPPPRGTVRVHIERLVLHGVVWADAKRVAAALEAELSGLASEAGQVFTPASAPRAAPVRYEAAQGPERTGRAAAAALWSSIKRAGGAER